MSLDTPSGYHYAYDGMYCDLDKIVSQAEEDYIARQEEKYRKIRKLEKLKIIKAISKKLPGYSSNESIREVLFKKIIKHDEYYMINRYASSENLPDKYVFIAKDQNGLETLIKGYIKHVTKTQLNHQLIEKIENIVEELYENKNNDIVYNRVALIRIFLYQIVEKKYGSGAGFQLPSDVTKNILSACRLHLNLYDIRHKNTEYIVHQIKLNKNQHKYEMSKKANKSRIQENKKNIPHWKARHMKTLLFFNNKESREVCNVIWEISLNISRSAYIDQALNKSYHFFNKEPYNNWD